MKYIGLLLPMLLLQCYATAQMPAPDFRNITVDDGLSHSSVYSILQDKQGFMWFGTYDGLSRYDGAEVAVYRTGRTQPYANVVRGTLCEDKAGNIWYANETGIYYYSRLSDSIETAYDLLKTNLKWHSFGTVLIDDSANLWLANVAAGVLSFNINTKQMTLYPNRAEGQLSARQHVTYAEDNRYIWLSRNIGEGLFRFDLKTKTFNRYFRGKEYYSVRKARNNLFLTRKGGIDVYNGNLKLIDFITPTDMHTVRGFARDLIADNYDRLWLACTESGLICHDLKTGRNRIYKRDNANSNSIAGDITTCLYVDRSDNLWIATDGAGVSKLDLKEARFKKFPSEDIHYPQWKDRFIKCFYEDKTGRIWFGTATKGFSVFDPRTGSVKTFDRLASGKPLTNVGQIFEDRQGQIWIGYYRGIAIYNPQTEKPVEVELLDLSAKETPADNFVFRMIQLGDGRILAATKEGLVVLSKNYKGQYVGTLRREWFLRHAITDIVQTDTDNLWFSTSFSGLFHVIIVDTGFRMAGNFFRNRELKCIHKDQQNKAVIWIGSGLGLLKFDTERNTYRMYDKKSGLANDYIYGILEDTNNCLWVSTNGGLSMYDKAKSSFVNYNYKNGLQSNEFNTGAYYKGRSGNFYFGGIKGFNLFNPEAVKKPSSIPAVALSRINVNDTQYRPNAVQLPNKTIELPYYRNNLSFKYAVLDYTLPDANRLHYQLMGWDNHPIVSYEKNIRYSNLQPGKYVLKVRGINGENVFSPWESITIVINPPFWQTPAFYILLTLMAITGIVFITRKIAQRKLKLQIAELKYQRALEQERERISREMHDDIAAGLTQITLMSRLAKRNGNMGKNNMPELEDITVTSRKLIDSMDEIIWSLNRGDKTLEHLLSYLREHLNKLLEYSGIEYKISLPEAGNHLPINNEQGRNLLMIVREMVHNAVKHSHAKNISVSGELNDTDMVITVIDDGVGFDVSKTYEGNGLRNIRYRVSRLNGQLKVDSIMGNETRFTLTIPISAICAPIL